MSLFRSTFASRLSIARAPVLRRSSLSSLCDRMREFAVERSQCKRASERASRASEQIRQCNSEQTRRMHTQSRVATVQQCTSAVEQPSNRAAQVFRWRDAQRCVRSRARPPRAPELRHAYTRGSPEDESPSSRKPAHAPAPRAKARKYPD